jgi:hypothetical protein
MNLPNNVTNIGSHAFEDCDGLMSITIPDSVQTIGEWTFSFCEVLNSVVLGSGVTSLGGATFAGCNALTQVYFRGNAPVVDSGIFVRPRANPSIYRLPGTLGWGATFSGAPVVLWYLPQPLILTSSPGAGVRSNQFGFTISWATNASVVVDACTNLANPVWTPLATNALVSGTNYFSDPTPPTSPQRFYRVTYRE